MSKCTFYKKQHHTHQPGNFTDEKIQEILKNDKPNHVLMKEMNRMLMTSDFKEDKDIDQKINKSPPKIYPGDQKQNMNFLDNEKVIANFVKNSRDKTSDGQAQESQQNQKYFKLKDKKNIEEEQEFLKEYTNEFQKNNRVEGLLQHEMNKRTEKYLDEHFQKQQTTPENINKKVKELCVDYVNHKSPGQEDQIFRIQKVIEIENGFHNDLEEQLSLLIKVERFNLEKMEAEGKPYSKKVVDYCRTKNRTLADFMIHPCCSIYKHYNNHIYFYTAQNHNDSDTPSFQLIMLDLDTLSDDYLQTKQIETKMQCKILGIVFLDKHKEDEENPNCHKCFNEKRHQDDLQDLEIAVIHKTNKPNKIDICIRSVGKPDITQQHFHLDQNLRQEYFCIGFGQWQNYIAIGRSNISGKSKSKRITYGSFIKVYERKEDNLIQVQDDSVIEIKHKFQSHYNYQLHKFYQVYKRYIVVKQQEDQLFHQEFDNFGFSKRRSQVMMPQLNDDQKQKVDYEYVIIQTPFKFNSSMMKFMDNQLKKEGKKEGIRITSSNIIADINLRGENSQDFFGVYKNQDDEYAKSQLILDIVSTDCKKCTQPKKQNNINCCKQNAVAHRYIRSSIQKDLYQNYRILKPWDPKTVSPYIATFFKINNNRGLQQFHPKFSDVFINVSGQIVIDDYEFKDKLKEKGADNDKDMFEKQFEGLKWKDTKRLKQQKNLFNSTSLVAQANQIQNTNQSWFCCSKKNALNKVYFDDNTDQLNVLNQENTDSDSTDNLSDDQEFKEIASNQNNQNESDNGFEEQANTSMEGDQNQKFIKNFQSVNTLKQSKNQNYSTKAETQNEDRLKKNSRTINMFYDDRTIIPRLHFDQFNQTKKQKIVLGLWKICDGTLEEEKNKQKQYVQKIVDICDDVQQNSNLVRMAPSSSIEKDTDRDTYRQNYQILILNESGMWAKIYEYQIKWSEKEIEKMDSEYSEILLVGMKILIFKNSIDSNEKKQLNFLPKYQRCEQSCNKQNYLIEGTQITPINDQSNDHFHLEMKNFNYNEYQFRSKNLNSGYKIYVEENDQSKQGALLFETRLDSEKITNFYINKETNQVQYYSNSEIQKKKSDKKKEEASNLCFTENEYLYLMEQQLIVMMNMIPKKDLRNAQNIFQNEVFDFLAPAEILKGNSVFDYVGHCSGIAQQLLKNQRDNRNMRKSILEQFLYQHTCPQCQNIDNVNLERDIFLNSLPKEQGWLRNQFDISNDLFFLNSLTRAIKEQDDNHANDEIETHQQLIDRYGNLEHIISNIFECEKEERSQQVHDILMFSINKLQNKQYKELFYDHLYNSYKKFFFNNKNGSIYPYSFFRPLDDGSLQINETKVPDIMNLDKVTLNIPISDRLDIAREFREREYKKFKIQPEKPNNPHEWCTKFTKWSEDFFNEFLYERNYDSKQSICFLIDIRPLLLAQKIHHDNGQHQCLEYNIQHTNEFFLTKFIKKVNETFVESIDDQFCVEQFIQMQFQNKTRKFFIIQVIFFAFFNLGPFLYQMLWWNIPNSQIIILNTMILISCFVLIIMELIEWRSSTYGEQDQESKSEYFGDFWNFIELFLFIIQGLFSFGRLLTMSDNKNFEDSSLFIGYNVGSMRQFDEMNKNT